ncbi:hypothetical protein I8H83_00915 [Candidatus Saccharibacteria bacterium]|nr:hypothetical protein [Candidatus Saccharibacteria bacterium]
MSLRTNSSFGQPNGTVVTGVNSGGGTNTAFSSISVGAGSSLVHENGWYRVNGIASQTAAAVWGSFATNTTYSISMTIKVPSTPPSATSELMTVRNASTAAARIYLNTAGKLQVFNAAGTSVYTFPTTLPTDGTPVTISFVVQPGASTTTGVVSAAYYLDYAQTPADPAYSSAAFNAGIVALANCHFGKPGASAWDTTGSGYYIRGVTADDGNTSLLLPVRPVNAIPSADAGLDIPNIEPWDTITLMGTDNDTDGTIATRTWRQVSGSPVVVINGSGVARTYEAPATIAGATLVFGYKVTDNLGAESVEDTVSHTIMPVTERAAIGGVEVPLRSIDI